MLENIKLSFQGIWGHKMRSLLTMLGIIIGIASIISIVSTIKGTNDQIKENLIGSGTNAVVVKLYQGDSSYDVEYMPIPDGVPSITEETRQKIEDLDVVEQASLFVQRTYVYNTYYKNTAFNGALNGVDQHYLSTNQYQIVYGRGLVEKDFTEFRKVAVLDETAVQSLFLNENPVGKQIEIQGEPYTVVGIASPSSDSEPVINSLEDYYMYMGDSSGTIFIPIVQWPNIYRYDEPEMVSIRATSTDDMTRAGNKAAEIINETLSVSNDSNLSYQSTDMSEQARKLQSLSSSTNMQLIWIASISLLVGGIGVMNIMLVSVTERTREIGLKKAIGARDSSIRWQFLTEAGVLTSLGGVIGVIVGVIMAQVISRLTGTPSAVSIPAILIAVVFSMVIGVVFGLIPAIKASHLNPIDALRRE
ncbi:MAG: ABC transporter permease [Butyricicoccus sp.]